MTNQTSVFAQKVIVITGASSGLGAVMAEQLAAPDVSLVLLARREDKLREVKSRCERKGAQVTCLVVDVCSAQDCELAADFCQGKYGRVDYLINNAGVVMHSRFMDVGSVALFDSLIKVNYLGSVYMTHAMRGLLQASEGLVCAISSIQGLFPVPYHTGYVAAKHAVEGFYASLRLEKPGFDILVVSPGWIAGTELKQNALTDKQAFRESSLSISVESVASQVIKAMYKRRSELALPKLLHLVALIYRWCRPLGRFIIADAYRKYARDD